MLLRRLSLTWLTYRAVVMLVFLSLSQGLFAQDAIRVGVYDNPPLSIRSVDGSPGGFVIDLLKHIATEEGWRLDFVSCRWNACNELLALGEIDLLSPMSVSEGRQRRLDYNRESLYVNWGQIVMAGKEEIHSPLDLNGKIVVAMSKDVHFADLKELVRRFDINVRFFEVSDYESVLSWVADGPVDAGLITRSVDMHNYEDLSLVKTSVIFNPAEIRVALSPRRGQLANALLIQRLDYHITRLKGDQNSLYYQLQKKWFGEDEGDQIPRWILLLLAAISGISILLSAGVLILRREVQRQTERVAQINQRFKAFMRNLPGLAYMKSGSDGRYIFTNTVWDRVYQMADRKVVGKLPSEIWPERNLPGLQYEEQQAIDQRRMIESEEQHPWDGRHWRMIHFPVEQDGDGELLLGVIGLDVTAQKEAESALKSLQSQQQLLLESAGDGIFGISGVGRCTFINSTALEMLGYEHHELIGHKVHDLLFHSQENGIAQAEGETPVYAAYREGEGVRVKQGVFWCADGTPVRVDYSAFPLSNRPASGAVVVFQASQDGDPVKVQ